MPHSSGGGSHGGGSHGGGGSSHSSSHSSGGGSSSGGSALTSTRVSTRRYRGCATYCYYEDNKPHYIYSSYGAKDKTPAFEIVQRIILWIFVVGFLLLLGGMMVWAGVKHPKKISPPHHKEIIIDDRAGLISSSEKDMLMKTLGEFFDKTGIVPAVVTVNNETWADDEHGYDFSKVAYNEYLELFKDEKHWLIMYSEPASPDPDFNDWYWEGMQGDNTDKLLTSDKAGAFTNDLHAKFLQRKKYTVGEAINSAFVEINGTIMNVQVNPVAVGSAAVMLLSSIPLTIYFLDIHPFKKALLKKSFYVRTRGDTPPLEAQCDYCGGTYVIGAHLACPFCYAPITPHDLAVDASGNVTKILK